MIHNLVKMKEVSQGGHILGIDIINLLIRKLLSQGAVEAETEEVDHLINRGNTNSLTLKDQHREIDITKVIAIKRMTDEKIMMIGIQ